MNNISALLVVLVVLAGALVGGCAQNISREGLRQVDKDVTFSLLRENPQEYVGSTVLLGGSIIEVENYPERTEFVVLHHELGFDDKPNRLRPSGGRFLVSLPQFLDPEIYKHGRWITVLGKVYGEQQLSVQSASFLYPVIAGQELYLWPLDESRSGNVGFHFGLGVGFGL